MKFTKKDGKFVAKSGLDMIAIEQDGTGWWVVTCNGKAIESFEPQELPKAKKWATAWYAA